MVKVIRCGRWILLRKGPIRLGRWILLKRKEPKHGSPRKD